VIDLADQALVNHALGERDGRGAAVVVADHVEDAGLADGRERGLGVLEVGGQRLLAEDVLAGLGGADDQLGVLVVGGGDVHQVNVLALEQLVHGEGDLGPAELLGGGAGALLGAAAEDLHHRLRGQLGEEEGDLAVSV